MNNLKQLGLAMLMYVEDYDGYFIPTGTAPNYSLPYGYWAARLDQYYVKNPRTFYCPSTIHYKKVEARLRDPVGSYNWREAHNFVSYGYNHRHIGTSFRYTNPNTSNSPPAKLSQLKNPSKTLLLCDAGNRGVNYTTGTYYVEDYEENNAFNPIHMSKGNVLMADGHVEVLGPVPPNVHPNNFLRDKFTTEKKFYGLFGRY
ncbi:MAG: hypothetical protein NC922_06825 [Candidatus Omnitrophica bacterium]|nr:hypothetical protein [Candidatus Omnitrophota bacterium]